MTEKKSAPDTLSVYNNNPGNLKPPKGVRYEGQIGVDENGFAVFENREYGRAALLNDVTRKIGRGIDTPDKFVDRFAPAGDENSEESRDNYKLYITTRLGLKSTSDPIPPDAASKLADAVSAFEGGTWSTPAAQEKAAPEPEPETAGEEGARVAPKAASDIPGVSESNKPFLGIVGGGIGASVAGGIETGKQILPLVPNLIGRISGNAPNPSTPMSRAGLQSYLNSQIAPNLRLPLTELEKVSGAGKIRTMSEVQNALKAIQAVEEQKVTKPMVRMVPGRPNVFEETGRFTSSTVPGRQGVDLSKYETPARGPVRQAVGRQMQTAGEVGKSLLPSAGRVGLGTLGGANALMSGYDAWELMKQIDAKKNPTWQDYARLASKTGATIGGGLSMLPFGVTQAVGFGLQAPEMVWSGAEALGNAARKATPEQVNPALTNVDLMGNPLGGLP